MTLGPSRTQVKKAGKLLRNYWLSDDGLEDLSEEEQSGLSDAYGLVVDYRSGFASPLLKVRVGLQSFIKTTGYPEAQIGQRLKRFQRIMEKLARYQNMQLTTMQDIGGCRVVMPDLDGVAKIRSHIEKVWGDSLVEVYDYISKPQESGYRAVHVVVRRDDRLIEVQLRTVRQHRWADAVEQYSRQLGIEMKWGLGGHRVQDGFARMADYLSVLDEGGIADVDNVLEELLGWADMIDEPED
ncbi:MAG: RelA/SpoT domain-containing protein [Acidimicrobiia bacterium]